MTNYFSSPDTDVLDANASGHSFVSAWSENYEEKKVSAAPSPAISEIYY